MPTVLGDPTEHTFGGVRLAVAISDPNLDDNPLVWVNDAFCKITGYTREDALGRNCRFLQGPDTDPKTVETLASAIAAREEIAVDIMNYRADGTPFLNRLLITAVGDDEDASRYFVGFQYPYDNPMVDEAVQALDARLRELQHRVKNHLALIVAMIRNHARRLEPREAAHTLAVRVETLALLYEHLNDQTVLDRRERVLLGAYLTRVCGAMQALSDNIAVRVTNTIDDVRSDAKAAANIGLILSELVTNALRHAFAEGEPGEVRIDVGRENAWVRIVVSDDGHGLGDSGWPHGGGLGGSIVRNLVDHAGGSLDVASGSAGTTIRLRFPAD
ncbi:MAG: PAS domain-containing protein [Paracoccaceae bacterium]